jgi:predicted DsbA family dithiol-disulfide isomerase
MTDQPAAESTTQIVGELWLDLVCPWCYIAKRRLEAAIGLFERPHDVTITIRAYELAPDLPPRQGNLVMEHLGASLGVEAEDGRLMTVRVSEAAVDEEIRFDWDRAVRANTFDAHRLCALALGMGGTALQSAMVERCLAAHFAEGLALDDVEVLQRISAEAGLDEHRVAAVLAGDDYATNVRTDEQTAHRLGITAIPYLLVNRRAALSGARTVEEYLTLLREIATDSL